MDVPCSPSGLAYVAVALLLYRIIHTARSPTAPHLAGASFRNQLHSVYQPVALEVETLDPAPEVWTQLDHYFHDLDVVAKESPLAFRALISCLDSEALGIVSADLNGLVQRRVRVAPAPLEHQSAIARGISTA